MKRLIIIGASGHGKVIADIAVLNGYKEIVFLDDDEAIKECAGYPVIAKTTEAPEGEIIVAIGNAEVRKRIMDYYRLRTFPVLVHPSAVVAQDVLIGNGSVVMAGTVINSGAKIGEGTIVNTASSIDHDCVVGDFVHVAVGAHLCGTVKVGENTWIGAGSIISNNIEICANCIIGAGTVVIKNMVEPGTYVGIPAVYIKGGKNK